MTRIFFFGVFFAGIGAAAAEIPFQAFGGWDDPAALADASAATVATWKDSGAPVIFILPQNESIVGSIEFKFMGKPTAIRGARLEISLDAISWRDAASVRLEKNISGATLFFDPAPARALRLTLEPGDGPVRLSGLSLIEAVKAKVAVTGVTFEDIGERSAVIRWKTNRPVKSQVMYGYRSDRMKTPSSPSADLLTEHRMVMEGLYPGIEYQVWILIDGRAYGSEPGVAHRFRSAGTPYPMPYDIVSTSGLDTAVIEFTTNTPTRCELEWRGPVGGAEQGEWKRAASRIVPREGAKNGNATGLDHVIALSGLQPRATYEYVLNCEDTLGRKTTLPASRVATQSFNVALGRPVTGTFIELLDEQTSEATAPALSRITDGRLDYFRGMATSGDPEDTHQWAEVDLGSERALASIDVVWRGNAYPRNFFVMTSRDCVEWKYPAMQIDAGAGSEERSERGDPLRRVSVSMEGQDPARYIRVFMPRGKDYAVKTPAWRFVQLAEIEAHASWKGR